MNSHEAKVQQSVLLLNISNNVSDILDICTAMPKLLYFNGNHKKNDWKIGTTKKNLQKLSDLHAKVLSDLVELNRHIYPESKMLSYSIEDGIIALTSQITENDISVRNAIMYTIMTIGQGEHDNRDFPLNLEKKMEPVITAYTEIQETVNIVKSAHQNDLKLLFSPLQKLCSASIFGGFLAGMLACVVLMNVI